MRVIVTGANSGVGKATATALAAVGHEVVITCRTVSKGEAAASAMQGHVKVAHLDLADLASVRQFAGDLSRVRVQDYDDKFVTSPGRSQPVSSAGIFHNRREACESRAFLGSLIGFGLPH